MDSVTVKLTETLVVLKDVQRKMGTIIDSIENDPTRLKNIIFNKLVSLKALYEA